MEYNIKFSQKEIQTILIALGELPLKLSLEVFGKINQTLLEQNNVQTQSIQSE